MKKYVIYIAMALLISGCSGGGGGEGETPAKTTSTIGVGEEVMVGANDSITPDTADTEVIVSHYLNDTRSIKVLSGSVSLLRGNYNVSQ